MIFTTSPYYMFVTSSDLRAPPRMGSRLWESAETLIQATLVEEGIPYPADDGPYAQSYEVVSKEIPQKGLYVVARGEDSPLEVREVFVYPNPVEIVERL